VLCKALTPCVLLLLLSPSSPTPCHPLSMPLAMPGLCCPRAQPVSVQLSQAAPLGAVASAYSAGEEGPWRNQAALQQPCVIVRVPLWQAGYSEQAIFQVEME